MAKCGPAGYLKLFFEPNICSTKGDYALIGTDAVQILQQKSLSRHVPAGTCTISFIIPKNANIYVNGLNSCKSLKPWWGYTHLLHIVVIIGKR